MLQLAGGFKFSLWDLLSSLVYARAVAPCSKSRTFHDVLPQLDIDAKFSLDQLCGGLAFLGQEYQKVVEIYNAHIAEVFPRNLDRAYFDCTNFYFEIDREHGLCKISHKIVHRRVRIPCCLQRWQSKVKKRSVPLTEKRVATYNPALAKKQRAEIDRQVKKARKLRLSQAKKSEYGDSAKFVSFNAVDSEGEVGQDTRVVATLKETLIN